MRILHLMNDVTDRGNGIVNVAVDVAIEQVRQGYTVAVAADHGGYEELLKRHGVTYIPYLQRTTNPFKLAVTVLGFPALVRRFQPDIVHAHMRSGALLAALWRKQLGYGLVTHLHNSDEDRSTLMRVGQRIVFVSEASANAWEERGMPQEKVRVVLNRTLGSLRSTTDTSLTPAKLQHPAILTVGGLIRRKGLKELIEAFDLIAEEFPAAQLYIVGDGADREEIKAQGAASPHANRIHFEGFHPHPQVYFRSADIFVLASHRESFGLVVLEARNEGCAIVATSVDGIPEALERGKAGILVPPFDSASLANALRTMLSSEETRRMWSARAKEGIEAFKIPRMIEELRTVYDELLADNCAVQKQT